MYKKWMDNFITQDKETKNYICWNEIQADIIGERKTLEEAYKLLQDYADSIENDLR
jgi:hypothetical protein